MAENTQRLIVEAMVAGIRDKLELKTTECYPILAPMYVEGQAKRVVQVIPGGVNPSGSAPRGGQTGGNLQRRQAITLTIWWRLKIDRHMQSVQLLIKESEGFLDFANTVREIFDMTTLGGLLTEPMYYDGETGTSWADMDKGICRRDINLSGMWACRRPEVATL